MKPARSVELIVIVMVLPEAEVLKLMLQFKVRSSPLAPALKLKLVQPPRVKVFVKISPATPTVATPAGVKVVVSCICWVGEVLAISVAVKSKFPGPGTVIVCGPGLTHPIVGTSSSSIVTL